MKTQNTNYNVGDKVKVVKCVDGHQFKIGTVVTLERYDKKCNDWYASDDSKKWWVSHTEIAPIKATTQKEQVLKHLRRGKKITPIEALDLYGCFRLSAIIHKLKRELKDGETIQSTLLRKGNKNFSQYSLTKIK